MLIRQMSNEFFNLYFFNPLYFLYFFYIFNLFGAV